MSATKSSRERVSDIIEYALSQPPAATGYRLRSERELATLFQTSHAHLRKSLDMLVDKGLLVRRRGSGTYVRRIPSFRSTPEFATSLPVPASELFVQEFAEGSEPSPLKPTRQQQQLHLGLWTDFAGFSEPSRQAVLNGIINRVEEQGHRITVHSLRDRAGTDLSDAELARRLANAPSDGYLVVAWWAERFLAALGSCSAPVVFFQDSSVPITHEPMVLMDTHEATMRAVRTLAQQGYRKIGLLALRTANDPEELVQREQIIPMQRAYRRSMEDEGLDYYAVEFAEPSMVQSIAALRRLLSREDPPHALYIADDVLLNGATELFELNKIVPGKDIGIITFSVASQPMPPGHNWSRLEFDVEGLGESAINSLLRLIQTAGARINSRAIYATWRPGDTHLRADTRAND